MRTSLLFSYILTSGHLQTLEGIERVHDRRIGCAMLLDGEQHVCRCLQIFKYYYKLSNNKSNRIKFIEWSLYNVHITHGIFAMIFFNKGCFILALANIEQFFSQQTAQKVHIHTYMHYIFQGRYAYKIVLTYKKDDCVTVYRPSGQLTLGHRVGRVQSVSPVVGIGTPPPL